MNLDLIAQKFDQELRAHCLPGNWVINYIDSDFFLYMWNGNIIDAASNFKSIVVSMKHQKIWIIIEPKFSAFRQLLSTGICLAFTIQGALNSWGIKASLLCLSFSANQIES